jgi:hypothetical protein
MKTAMKEQPSETYIALMDAIIILGNRECEIIMVNPALNLEEAINGYSALCRARWRIEARLEGLLASPPLTVTTAFHAPWWKAR